MHVTLDVSGQIRIFFFGGGGVSMSIPSVAWLLSTSSSAMLHIAPN